MQENVPFPLREGVNKPTPLPALSNPVDIPKGTTQAFYIYLEYGLRYSVGSNVGSNTFYIGCAYGDF